MRKVREILRLRWEAGLSQRKTAESAGVAGSTVWDCEDRAKRAGLGWPLPPDLDDGALESMLYSVSERLSTPKSLPDWSYVHREMKRKGVTLQLLWQEYVEQHGEHAYRYSQYCKRYRAYRSNVDIVMRQDHRAGEKLFTDYSGDGIKIIDRRTGELSEGQLFVAALGASSFTYSEVTATQTTRDWIRAHVHAYEFFGGVPEITVPDQPKPVATLACRYEPGLNPTFEEMGRHYGTVIIPARPKKPRDKGKAEAAVLVAQRWILAVLRNHVIHSIPEANELVWKCLAQLNDRPLQRLKCSRRELFSAIDRPALKPLPQTRYEYADWSRPRVNIDYHVEVDGHYYSVPYQLRKERVDARLTASIVEIFYRSKRITSHRRSYERGRHTTFPEHMPKSHREHAEWTPSRLISWGAKAGKQTAELIKTILDSRPHPEQGYRSCLGIMRLGKKYGFERLEAASRRALYTGTISYRSLSSILQSGLDREPLPEEDDQPSGPLPFHENVRGPEYYA